MALSYVPTLSSRFQELDEPLDNFTSCSKKLLPKGLRLHMISGIPMFETTDHQRFTKEQHIYAQKLYTGEIEEPAGGFPDAPSSSDDEEKEPPVLPTGCRQFISSTNKSRRAIEHVSSRKKANSLRIQSNSAQPKDNRKQHTPTRMSEKRNTANGTDNKRRSECDTTRDFSGGRNHEIMFGGVLGTVRRYDASYPRTWTSFSIKYSKSWCLRAKPLITFYRTWLHEHCPSHGKTDKELLDLLIVVFRNRCQEIGIEDKDLPVIEEKKGIIIRAKLGRRARNEFHICFPGQVIMEERSGMRL